MTDHARFDGAVPDHSTFSKNRHGRFRDSDLLRRLFEATVERCLSEGLVGGEGFAVDGSLIRADANRQRGQTELPSDVSSRAVREYFEVLDDAAFGGASPVAPKVISPTDPAARWTAQHGGAAEFCYQTNYLIDLDHGVIVDVEATTAVRQAEVTAAKRMIERAQDRYGLWPERLAADTGYGSAEMLAWLVHEKGIEPHVPVFDRSARNDGTFNRDEFRYDAMRDIVRCPGGKPMHTSGTPVNGGTTVYYRASKHDCSGCALKPRCCPKEPQRRVPRSIHEGARDLARDLSKTDAWLVSRRERKKVEMLFAHLKRILKLDRLRLRGPCSARDEFHLAAAAQNLRRMAKLLSGPKPITA